MKKTFIPMVLSVLLVLSLAACGEKSQEDVMSSLDEKLNEMSSYKADAKMTLETGKDPQIYEVEIWYKKPSYYRVLLKNAEKDQSQMILRNDDGVFVLTPALNKSFRFQSEWPENSSQPYLFESLARDILNDPESAFTAKDSDFVFETKTNYQNNKMLPRQEITLNKKNLAPRSVKVMDQDGNALVKVEYSKFDWDADFDKNAFDMDRNMTSEQIDMPTMAEPKADSFEVLYPVNKPEGVKLVEEKEMKTENGKRVVLTFGGEKSFTMIEETASASESAAPVMMDGEPAQLHNAVAAVTDTSITWTDEGVDYYLVSNDLTKEEMLDIARSVQGQAIK